MFFSNWAIKTCNIADNTTVFQAISFEPKLDVHVSCKTKLDVHVSCKTELDVHVSCKTELDVHASCKTGTVISMCS